MSLWNKQKLDALQQQAVQRLCAAELELMAAKAVLSEIEKEIVINHLLQKCGVFLRRGVCTFNAYPDGPIDVVVEKIHPILYTYDDHVSIEFRAFTKKGKPCKTTGLTTFEYLSYFSEKPKQQAKSDGGGKA